MFRSQGLVAFTGGGTEIAVGMQSFEPIASSAEPHGLGRKSPLPFESLWCGNAAWTGLGSDCRNVRRSSAGEIAVASARGFALGLRKLV